MKRLMVNTKQKREVIDITEIVENLVGKGNLVSGICHVFTPHTTAAVTTADLDPGTDLDLLGVLENLIPDIKFRHEHKPEDAPDHILGTIVGAFVSVPFIDRSLVLGTWQRIILIEFDGPREREVVVTTSD